MAMAAFLENFNYKNKQWVGFSLWTLVC